MCHTTPPLSHPAPPSACTRVVWPGIIVWGFVCCTFFPHTFSCNHSAVWNWNIHDLRLVLPSLFLASSFFSFFWIPWEFPTLWWYNRSPVERPPWRETILHSSFKTICSWSRSGHISMCMNPSLKNATFLRPLSLDFEGDLTTLKCCCALHSCVGTVNSRGKLLA